MTKHTPSRVDVLLRTLRWLLACQLALGAAPAYAAFCDDYPTECSVVDGIAFPTSRSQHWDFEDGALNGWPVSNSPVAALDGVYAFSTQPTYGDNVSAEREVGTSAHGTARSNALSLGGDFRKTGFPVHHRGSYWLGTFEARRTPAVVWSNTQGNGRTGRLTSAIFPIDRNYLHFKIGGGCSSSQVGVRLETSTLIPGSFIGGEFTPSSWSWPPTMPAFSAVFFFTRLTYGAVTALAASAGDDDRRRLGRPAPSR